MYIHIHIFLKVVHKLQFISRQQINTYSRSATEVTPHTVKNSKQNTEVTQLRTDSRTETNNIIYKALLQYKYRFWRYYI